MFLAPGLGADDALAARRPAGDADPPPWGLPDSPGKGQPRRPPNAAAGAIAAGARAAASALATASVSAAANRNMLLRMSAVMPAARLVFRRVTRFPARQWSLWHTAYVRTWAGAHRPPWPTAETGTRRRRRGTRRGLWDRGYLT